MLYAARYTIEAPTRREELAHQRALAEKLLAYAQSRLPPGGRTSVQLIAAEGKEGFYEKLGLLRSVENVGSIEDVSREIFRSLGIGE